ncbi:MAG: F0F1 ATP synthase subunit [Desulfomicrobium sp.]|nr:F0F1 ATP synthase subunit [Desulfomicrobium sp.]NLV96468.1 ATPase F0F1 [Desulfovibrionales bacterium]
MTEPEDPALASIRRRARQLKRGRRSRYSPLHGLGAFGVIGWSVTLPAVGGALLGLWLNRVVPRDFSWAIALMLGGLVLGMVFAVQWIAGENRAVQQEHEPEAVQKEDHD